MGRILNRGFTNPSVMRLLIVFLLFIFSQASFAVTVYRHQVSLVTPYFKSYTAVCDYIYPRVLNDPAVTNKAIASTSTSSCVITYDYNGYHNTNTYALVTSNVCTTAPNTFWNDETQACEQPITCGENYTYNANTNTCTPDQVTCTYPQVLDTNTNTCVTDCAALKGATTSWFSTSGSGSDQCMEGCTVVMNEGECAYNTSGQQGCFFKGSYIDQSCNTAPPSESPSNDPAFDCLQQGKSYGTVQGVVVCVDKGSEGSTPITDLQSGTKTTTDANGTTTQETSVSADGSTVTKTTTTIDPNGNTTEQTETQDKLSFCEENPNSNICKDLKDPCEDHPERVGCMEQGTPDEGEAIATSDISLDFSPVNLPSASGCPTPESVTIHGFTIPLKYDTICQYASAFHPFVIIFAWIAAAYIIAGAITKE
jgi:hypothetical protein